MEPLKEVFFRTSRKLERTIPLDLLWLIVWPLSAMLAARHMRLTSPHVPVPRLPVPPDAPRPSRWSRWRFLTRFQEHWWLLAWLDRLAEPRWQRRLEVVGLEHLRGALNERGVIIATLHTTALVALAAMVRSQGITTAAAPVDPSWFRSNARKRKVKLAEEIGASVFGAGSAREIVEFLRPGSALVMAVDHTTKGRTIDVTTRDVVATAALAPVRLAHSARAAVVPVLMIHTGPWRYRMEILEPVPQLLIETADYQTATCDVLTRLLPTAMKMPEQAMDVLVEALRPAG